MKHLTLLLLISLLGIAQQGIKAQTYFGDPGLKNKSGKKTDLSDEKRREINALTDSIGKRKSEYTKEDWQALIDVWWGEGLSTDMKLEIFDRYWKVIDEEFACFNRLDIDWQLLRQLYRPEIEAGVSRGRFQAILSHMNLALMDGHTYALNSSIAMNISEVGIPLIGRNNPFDSNANNLGAALSPLPDSTLLVYKVVENHPLGLKPGDRVIGYEGVPWSILYKQLLSCEIPLANLFPGCTKESTYHFWLTSAANNAHLFETVDIIKYGHSDTLHLSTEPLHNVEIKIYANPQLSVQGVDFPDYENGQSVSFGVLEGSNIAYVYMYDWFKETGGDDFKDFMEYLLLDSISEGLILDTRFNSGGDITLAIGGIEPLFNNSFYTLGWSIRENKTDHLKLTKNFSDFNRFYERDKISGNDQIYGKPIAILTGPASISVGDIFPYVASKHQYSRTFGKPTAGAFSSYDYGQSMITSNKDFYFKYAVCNFFSPDSSDVYLAHTAPPVDEEIWLEPDAVAKGVDNVVARAVEWINQEVYPYSAIAYDVYQKPGTIYKTGVHIKNSDDHEVAVWSYLYNKDLNLIDSIELQHIDSSYYSAEFLLSEQEADYHLGFKSFDLTKNVQHEISSANFFTTKGPIKYMAYRVGNDSIINPKTHPGDRFSFHLLMYNAGKSSILNGIKIKAKSLDPAINVYRNESGPTNIDPLGTTWFQSGLGIIVSDTAKTAEYPIQLNIYKDDQLTWIDTMYLAVNDGTVDITELQTSSVSLQQNFPNPFTHSSHIVYQLPKQTKVQLTVYDVTGRRVCTLVNQQQQGGYHQELFDASGLQSGIYIYELRTEKSVQSRRMIKN
ncbi:T9SS type A sorting domain-containing protein [Maribellus mangrovi]|uniref:T9SS type A sorting domain-containing protein n=1 Tax=Maribellus mangrovi TaxID=3133146 RepID=UPI0030EF5344